MQHKRCAATVSLSGGVDSTAVALILVERGYNTNSIFIRSWQDRSAPKEWMCAMCTSHRTFNELQPIDLSSTYKEYVLKELLENYQEGNAPNPDIVCNLYLKFGTLQKFLGPIGSQLLVTGHYSRSIWRWQRMLPFQTNCPFKDQSYFLYPISSILMVRSAFPLGSLKKRIVKKALAGLSLADLTKSDSTGICLTNPFDFRNFMLEYIKAKFGPTEDVVGNVVGEHIGIPFYVLGQRKYVAPISWLGNEKKMKASSLCSRSNVLVLGDDSEQTILSFKVLMISKMGAESNGINLNDVLLLKIRSQKPRPAYCFIFTSNLKCILHKSCNVRNKHLADGCIISNMINRYDGIIGQHAVVLKRGLRLGGGRILDTYCL